MLRAGPFSDQRVIGLANRRFVPFYFDLSDSGVAGDADARQFVVAQREELGGRSVPTPPLLMMTPDGEVVGEVSNYASADTVLAKMLAVLGEHPEYAVPSAKEQAVEAPIERAQIAIELQDIDGAWRELADVEGDAAHYLRGHLSRLAQDWPAMAKHFERVQDDALADEIRMERAYQHWYRGDFERLLHDLEQFPESSPRHTEARYYLGLAHYHLGDVETARETWQRTIEACSQDPWIYRADWAYSNTARKKRGSGVVFSSTAGNRTSLLGRIGYMGRDNPDLQRR